MITHYLKTHAPVSRSMLLLSLCLHGFCLGAVISLYPLLMHSRKPMELSVSRVRLVAPKIDLSAPERLHPDRRETDVVTESRTIHQSETAPKASERTAVTVQPKVAPEVAEVSIPLRKRQRPLARVEAPKPKRPPDPEAKQARKMEDPQAVLEKRLAALRDEVEKKKTDASQSNAAERRPDPQTRPTAFSGGNDGATDPESIRWLEAVRTGINARWSLFVDSRDLRRVAIVGVQIAEDGALTDAAVDKGSGDEVFDRSALRAVQQAAPFPAVPARVRELIGREGGLALRFTPSGIQ